MHQLSPQSLMIWLFFFIFLILLSLQLALFPRFFFVAHPKIDGVYICYWQLRVDITCKVLGGFDHKLFIAEAAYCTPSALMFI